jgi:hypothetical protein
MNLHQLIERNQVLIQNHYSIILYKSKIISLKHVIKNILFRIPSYKGYDQHDSHELFMNLMLILRAEEIQVRLNIIYY